MTKSNFKKILLAIDGSDGALEAVKYVSKMYLAQKMGVVLFNVYSKIPEAYWDLEKSVSLGWRLREIRAWEMEYEKTIQEYMERAKKILWRAGFDRDSVKVNLHIREKGIARDIIKEAKKGYDCIVVGRKGMSRLKDLALGSVSTKLLQKIDFAPLLVVGKNPKHGTVLLALDGSKGAMKAVNFMGNLLGDSGFELELIHVIRGEKKEYIQEVKREMRPLFDEAKNRLLKSGFGLNQLATKIITGTRSRAVSIVQEAKDGGYGTIVVGRRGLSRTQEFFIGRVSNKVIHLAKNHAVWVIN